jgi:putative DNA-invertase from lambdoid prophage Rac
MSQRISYYRCSTLDQSVEAQRHALLQDAGGQAFDEEFKDVGVSGAIPAAQRPGFSELLKFIRKGDTLYVYSVDRLGRDALDVQSTVRKLLEKGVAVEIRGLGRIAKGAGELVLAVLAQVGDMERQRIIERTNAGRAKARESLAATGRTHRGKASLGRPMACDPSAVKAWREANKASIAATAKKFEVSLATAKRYLAT